MKLYRVLNGIAWLMLIAFGLRYYVLDEPYLSYPNLPFPVLNNPVHAGEVVKLKVSRCSSDDKTRLYLVSHTLDPVGPGQNTMMPATQTSIEPGCSTITSAINFIPLGTPPGLYTVTGYGEVAGRIRTFSVLWHSKEFEVIP